MLASVIHILAPNKSHIPSRFLHIHPSFVWQSLCYLLHQHLDGFVALPAITLVRTNFDTSESATPDTKTFTALVVNDSLWLYFVSYSICETIQAKVTHLQSQGTSVVCLIQSGFLPTPFQSNSIARFNTAIPNSIWKWKSWLPACLLRYLFQRTGPMLDLAHSQTINNYITSMYHTIQCPAEYTNVIPISVNRSGIVGIVTVVAIDGIEPIN